MFFPFVAPSRHNTMRPSKSPLIAPTTPPFYHHSKAQEQGSSPPPSLSSFKHHHTRKKFKDFAPGPSNQLHPPTDAQQGQCPTESLLN